jgi:deoxyadenosine/deoxycytidine kinase
MTDRIKPPIVIALDGEIGAGKTTLIKLLASYFNSIGLKTVAVLEPVDDWKEKGILQEFYQEKIRRDLVTYVFQTYTFVTRIEEILQAFDNNPDAQIFILERTVMTDRYVFMENQRDVVEASRVALMQMYEKWWKMWTRLMPFEITHHIYLKPSLEECMTRVNSRAREGEVVKKEAAPDKAKGVGGVSREYQAILRETHEAFLQGMHREKYPNMPETPAFSPKPTGKIKC